MHVRDSLITHTTPKVKEKLQLKTKEYRRGAWAKLNHICRAVKTIYLLDETLIYLSDEVATKSSSTIIFSCMHFSLSTYMHAALPPLACTTMVYWCG